MTISLSTYGQPMDAASTTKRAFPTYTGPTSYATGGEAGLAAACRVSLVFAVVGAIITNGTTVLLGVWNNATAKLQWFDMAGAEVTNTTNLSTYSGTFEVIGRG